jgi:hypothetical protein
MSSDRRPWFSQTSKAQRKRAHLAYRAASIIATDRMANYRPEPEVLSLFRAMARFLETAFSPRGVFQ